MEEKRKCQFIKRKSTTKIKAELQKRLFRKKVHSGDSRVIWMGFPSLTVGWILSQSKYELTGNGYFLKENTAGKQQLNSCVNRNGPLGYTVHFDFSVYNSFSRIICLKYAIY